MIFVEISVFGNKLFAQSDISMATHWYNKANYNPAFIARTDYIYLFTNVRKQWYGVKGTPTVTNLQGSMFVGSINSAFGLSVVTDQIGLSVATNPMLSYAYMISDNHEGRFSMGLSLGVFSRFIDGAKFNPYTGEDPLLHYEMEKIIKPDANVGLQYDNNHFTLGASVTHLFSVAKIDSLFSNTTHFYGYGVYKNSDLDFMNYSVGTQVVMWRNLFVVEGNIMTTFLDRYQDKEYFDLGLTYRTSKQLTAMIGIPIASNFKVGYAYNQTFSPGYNANSTHEIVLEYRIPSEAASTKFGSAGCKTCKEQRNSWYH